MPSRPGGPGGGAGARPLTLSVPETLQFSIPIDSWESRPCRTASGRAGGVRLTRKEYPPTHAAAMLHLAFRAVLLSGQAQCLDREKQRDTLISRVLEYAGPRESPAQGKYRPVFQALPLR